MWSAETVQAVAREQIRRVQSPAKRAELLTEELLFYLAHGESELAEQLLSEILDAIAELEYPYQAEECLARCAARMVVELHSDWAMRLLQGAPSRLVSSQCLAQVAVQAAYG